MNPIVAEMTEAERSGVVERLMLDYPCTRKQALARLEMVDRRVEPLAELTEPKVKLMKRWRCRGAVCDAHLQREALRLFRQTWPEIELSDVERISRYGHWV